MTDTYGKNNNSYDEFESQAESKDSSKNNSNNIMTLLKQPKNLIIAGITLLFIVILASKLLSSPKPQATKTPIVEKFPTVATETAVVTPVTPVVTSPVTPPPVIEVAPPALPKLDVNLLNKINSFDSKSQKDAEDEINSLDLERIKKELEQDDEEEDVPEPQKASSGGFSFDDIAKEENVPIIPQKARKVNPDNPPPPIVQSGFQGPVDKTSKKNLSDFIFIDSSLDAELSEDAQNEGKKIPNLGNIIAQGRIIDAILETAIDSSIPGTIRAVVSRDVYAEAGRSILIPKGSRLYGTYSAGGANSGRVIITWSRIIRPDGISLGIDSFASDQFGRAGIEGDVDKKYGEIIASALLLSSIPLVATIATQQITGARSSTTVTNSNGTVTTTKDAVDNATERFSNQIATATEKVVKGLIDTTFVVKVAQGTRLKVMVNQDLKLPRYKPITSLNTTVTNSSQ
jgi:type IV secretory pathway VirB10-like protein